MCGMQYQVPQFIETEDKIVGPFSLRQFLYLAAGGALIFILFFFLKLALWIIFAVIIGVLAAALALIKINGRPLTKVLMAAIGFYLKPRMYLWQRTDKPSSSEIKFSQAEESGQTIQNLSQKLTTNREPIQKRERVVKPQTFAQPRDFKGKYEVLRKITGEREVAKRVDFR